MLFVAGFAVMLQVGASNTLIQSMVPDHLRGRAMSVYSMMYIGIGPFGAMAAGFAAGRVRRAIHDSSPGPWFACWPARCLRCGCRRYGRWRAN